MQAPVADVVEDALDAVGYLLPVGRSEEALAEIRLARELDPLSPSFALDHAFILHMARSFDAAEQRGCPSLVGGSKGGSS
jgi:hypothetical protein